MKDRKKIITQTINNLVDHYSDLLNKNYKFQMGDDDYQLTTYEYNIHKGLQAIINDLKNSISE